MSPDSPWYQFHPDSIGWLHRKVAAGENVTNEDLARIARVGRQAFADPVLESRCEISSAC